MNPGEETFSQHWLTPFRMIASTMRRDIEQYVLSPVLDWRMRRSPRLRQRILDTFLKEFPEFSFTDPASIEEAKKSPSLLKREDNYLKALEQSNQQLYIRARRYAEQKWLPAFAGGLAVASGFGLALFPAVTLTLIAGNIGNLILAYGGSLPKNSQSLIVKVAGFGLTALYLLGVGLTGGVFALSMDLFIRCIASMGALVTADFIPQERKWLRALLPAGLWLGGGYMVAHSFGLTSGFLAHVPWITGVVGACAATLHDRYSRHTRAITTGGTIPLLLYFNMINGSYLNSVFGLFAAFQYGRTMLKYDAPLFSSEGSRLLSIRRFRAWTKTLFSRAPLHQHGITLDLLERLGFTQEQLAAVKEKGVRGLQDIPSLDRIPPSLLEFMARVRNDEISPLVRHLFNRVTPEGITKLVETNGKRNSYARMKKVLAARNIVSLNDENIKNFSRDDADILHMAVDVFQSLGSPPFKPTDGGRILRLVAEHEKSGEIGLEILYSVQLLRLLRERDRDDSGGRMVRTPEEPFRLRLQDVEEDVEWYSALNSAFSGILNSSRRPVWMRRGKDIRTPLINTGDEEVPGILSPYSFAEVLDSCYGNAEIRFWQKTREDIFARSLEYYEEAFVCVQNVREFQAAGLIRSGQDEKIAAGKKIYRDLGYNIKFTQEEISPEDERELCRQTIENCEEFFKSHALELQAAKEQFGDKTVTYAWGIRIQNSVKDVRGWYDYAKKRRRTLIRETEQETKREKRQSRAPRQAANSPSLANVAKDAKRPDPVRAQPRRLWDMRPWVH